MDYQCELFFAINFENNEEKIKEFKNFISDNNIGLEINFDKFKFHEHKEKYKILYFYHEGNYSSRLEDKIKKYQKFANQQDLENIYIFIGEEAQDITYDHNIENIGTSEIILHELFTLQREVLLDSSVRSVSVEEYMKQNPED